MTAPRRNKPAPRGRRPLPSTFWLAARLTDECKPRYLFAEWQRVYTDTTGWKHIDARRSFRAALKNARKLQKERNHE